MTHHLSLKLATLSLMLGCLLCCNARTKTEGSERPWYNQPSNADAPGQTVTIVIALSSIVPGGILGHTGLAVGDAFYDFGPKRSNTLGPIKSIRSKAGPWWDDPDQQWVIDRSLDEVLADMPDKVHPIGSLVAIIQVQVTDEQAQAINAFWQDTYVRMREGEDTYRLSARQCTSMVAWSLEVGLGQQQQGSQRLPRDLHLMTPTKLYEDLSTSLTHTAGPASGQPADLTLWQLGSNGFEPWQRSELSDAFNVPELTRIRLAYERIKHLPKALAQ